MNKKAKKILCVGNEIGDSAVTSVIAGLPLPIFIFISVIYYLIIGGIVLIVKKLVNYHKKRRSQRMMKQ